MGVGVGGGGGGVDPSPPMATIATGELSRIMGKAPDAISVSVEVSNAQSREPSFRSVTTPTSVPGTTATVLMENAEPKSTKESVKSSLVKSAEEESMISRKESFPAAYTFVPSFETARYVTVDRSKGVIDRSFRVAVSMIVTSSPVT